LIPWRWRSKDVQVDEDRKEREAVETKRRGLPGEFQVKDDDLGARVYIESK
jgi:hypothetical protein